MRTLAYIVTEVIAQALAVGDHHVIPDPGPPRSIIEPSVVRPGTLYVWFADGFISVAGFVPMRAELVHLPTADAEAEEAGRDRHYRELDGAA